MPYNLITLDGKALLEQVKAGKALDLRGPAYSLLVSSLEQYPDNALFYQLLSETNGDDQNPDALKNYLVFVDFSRVFSSQNFETVYAPVLREIFDNTSTGFGLNILLGNGQDTTHFVPFDKSASMARNCQISFLASSIKAAMDKRLLLDMDFGRIAAYPSKLYAYRGLYLTAARRIPQTEKFQLNAETVVVISDDQHYIDKVSLYTAKEIDGCWAFCSQTGRVQINSFDGEGILSPAYAQAISQALGISGGTSFQVRMPFTKGMLHQVDFHQFFRNELHCSDADVWWMIDPFGIKRDLRKAQIILTESMFKCHSWLREQAKISDAADPMAYYFARFRQYDHGLYVGNTNRNLSGGNRIKLNYQFLGTLDMDGSEFQTLIDSHAQETRQATQTYAAKSLQNADTISQDDQTGDTERAAAAPWLQALSKNSAFLRDPKVSGILSGIQQGMTRDCGTGRLECRGQTRFLSCDLLAFLLHLAMQLENSVNVQSLQAQCLRSQSVHLPQGKALGLQGSCAMLRNPHLSREEQCLLRPYTSDLYQRYFGGLSGVAMVSRSALAPMILGGADFDGDLVKVISEPAIVRAVARGTCQNRSRKLPIIQIPAAQPPAKVLDSGSIPYQTLKDTFSNQIGQISNAAITLGKLEYFSDSWADQGPALNPDAAHLYRSADCTIITGLEIDAAKSGRHPSQNIANMLAQKVPDEQSTATPLRFKKDYFLECKDKIANLSAHVTLTTGNAAAQSYNVYLRGYNQAYMRVWDYGTGQAANIDRLPHAYVRLATEKLPRPALPRQRSPRFFAFQQEGWEQALDVGKREQVRQLISDYLAIQRKMQLLRQAKKRYQNSRYSGCVMTLLQLQYDDLDEPLTQDNTVRSALLLAYGELDQIFAAESPLERVQLVENSINTLIARKWQYASPETRPNLLCEVLGAQAEISSAAVTQLLSNFDCAGYKLLYYILKDMLCHYTQPLDADGLEQLSAVEAPQSRHYLRLNEIFLDGSREKKAASLIQSEQAAYCRTQLTALLGTLDQALPYVVSLRSVDKSAGFMWEVFPAQVLLDQIETQKQEVPDHA
jgi:hypothetical protein